MTMTIMTMTMTKTMITLFVHDVEDNDIDKNDNVIVDGSQL